MRKVNEYNYSEIVKYALKNGQISVLFFTKLFLIFQLRTWVKRILCIYIYTNVLTFRQRVIL